MRHEQLRDVETALVANIPDDKVVRSILKWLDAWLCIRDMMTLPRSGDHAGGRSKPGSREPGSAYIASQLRFAETSLATASRNAVNALSRVEAREDRRTTTRIRVEVREDKVRRHLLAKTTTIFDLEQPPEDK